MQRDATSQQNPQAMPILGSSYTEGVGATIPTHVSSTTPAAALSIAAAPQSNASFGGLSQGSWFFDPANHRSNPYGMPSSFMVGLHTNPSSFSESLNAMLPPPFRPWASIPCSNIN